MAKDKIGTTVRMMVSPKKGTITEGTVKKGGVNPPPTSERPPPPKIQQSPTKPKK